MPNRTNTSSNNSDSPQGSSPVNPRMSDIAFRKKKNADAQAAFRARRANYIATLEETVTSLEAVVLQLQDSCRESRSDVSELRQENARLRHEFREREKFWKVLWQTRKSGHNHNTSDLPQPSSFSPSHSHQNLNAAQLSSSHVSQYGNESSAYRASNEPSAPICSPYSASPPSQSYPSQSPSLSYIATNEISADGSSHQLNSHRLVGKYGYPYSMHNGSQRDSQWHTPSNGDGVTSASNGSSQSPGYSPTLTASDTMSYVNRYTVDEQKVPLNHLDTAPYVFPSSRSISPTVSTPPSSSSTSLTSPFQFTFPEGSVAQDRTEYDYRRHSGSHTADVSLHTGGPDLSLAGPGSDAVRYRLGARRTNSGDRPSIPGLPPLSGSDNRSQNDHEGEPRLNGQHQRPRRGTVTSRSSRSPSPDTPPISGTLAVIKAQAFGALRRTRSRPKKAGESASRAAMEALEARGIGLSVGASAGNKRPRLDSDDGDAHQ